MPSNVCRSLPILVVSCGVAAQPPGFMGLGDVDPGPINSAALAISANALVVTGRCTPLNFQRVFSWTSAGMIELPSSPNLATGLAISGDGSAIVGNNSTLTGDVRAFKYTAALGFQSLLAIGSQSPGPQVFAISADGSVAAGETNTALAPKAVRWPAPGTGVALSNELGLIASSARGISADGSTIVGIGSNPLVGGVGFRWSLADGMSLLPDLEGGAAFAGANAISGDGSTIVGFANSADGQEACVWIGGVPFGLGDLPGGAYESSALAVSADGSKIVGYATTDAGQEAFIWDSTHGMRNLKAELDNLGVPSTAGWILSQATGISADGGTIVGFGLNPDGLSEAWLAVFPGAPACYANCDHSTIPPVLNIQDFVCFLNLYAAADSGANCDGSTVPPTLNVNDFMCFLNAYAAGC